MQRKKPNREVLFSFSDKDDYNLPNNKKLDEF